MRPKLFLTVLSNPVALRTTGEGLSEHILCSALRAHFVRPNSLPANLSNPVGLWPTGALISKPATINEKAAMEGGFFIYGWG